MKTENWLVAWVGQADLDASMGLRKDAADPGPIGEALTPGSPYNRVHLLCNYPADQAQNYLAWLRKRCHLPAAALEVTHLPLSSPVDYGAIYAAVSEHFAAQNLPREGVKLTFHLSPGTPAMAAIWIILAKTRFPAQLIQTERGKGAQPLGSQLDRIAQDFLPDYLSGARRCIAQLSRHGHADVSPAFDGLVAESDQMSALLAQAQRLALFEVPVLMVGSNGHPFEELARAIHRASSRPKAAFRSVHGLSLGDDDAIAHALGIMGGVNPLSHLQGRRGNPRPNQRSLYEQAAGGTLFIAEVELLSPAAQAALLQALTRAEPETPPLDTEASIAPTRVVVSTQVDLNQWVRERKFRADLLRRLGVGVLRFAPLAERQVDVAHLLSTHLARLNKQWMARVPNGQSITLTESARNMLLNHPWPGQEEELYQVLLRAVIAGPSPELDEHSIRQALCFEGLNQDAQDRSLLYRRLDEGFSLDALLAEVEKHYLDRALQQCSGNKSRAAQLLGIKSHQNFTNRMAAAQSRLKGTEHGDEG